VHEPRQIEYLLSRFNEGDFWRNKEVGGGDR
jgi:hypothetical protein